MLGNKPCNYYYWYNDNFMYFTFNGVHSADYHLFIQKSKELTLENSVGASSEYTNATLQEGTYYLGTSRKQKTFKRKCAAEGLTLQQYKRMMKWLSVGTTGELVFDSNPYWGWTVVLDTVGDATFVGNNDFLVVEFEITFKTIGTYLAHNIYAGTWISDSEQPLIDSAMSNQYGIPVVVGSEIQEEQSGNLIKQYIDFHIQNINNEYQNFTFLLDAQQDGEPVHWEGSYNFKVDYMEYDPDTENYNPIPYLLAEFEAPEGEDSFSGLDYRSNSSTLYINGRIAEEDMYCKSTSQTNGIMKLESQEPTKLNGDIEITDDGIVITLDELSWNIFTTGAYDYICFSEPISQKTRYNANGYNQSTYLADYKTAIAFLHELYDNEKCGTFTIDEDDKKVIIQGITLDWDPVKSNIYCGYSHHVRVTIEGDPTKTTMDMVDKTYIIQIQSYNNL